MVRALKQAARELMLAQASDWTFIMSTGTTVPYATRRFNEHVVRFNRLAERGGRGADTIDEAQLARLEATDNIFPDVDYRIYAIVKSGARHPAEKPCLRSPVGLIRCSATRPARSAPCHSKSSSSRRRSRPFARPAGWPTWPGPCPRPSPAGASTCAW